LDPAGGEFGGEFLFEADEALRGRGFGAGDEDRLGVRGAQ
jgi:hypothetical protein